MRIFRTPPAEDPLVRCECNGNKYYLPKSQTVRNPSFAAGAGVNLVIAGLAVAIVVLLIGIFGH